MVETTKLLAAIRETAELQLLAVGYHLTGAEIDNLARNIAQAVVVELEPPPIERGTPTDELFHALGRIVLAMRCAAPQAHYLTINLFDIESANISAGVSFQTPDDPSLVELANTMNARVRSVAHNRAHWLEARAERGACTIHATGPHRPIPEAMVDAVEHAAELPLPGGNGAA